MPAKARMTVAYRWRRALLAAMGLGFGLWALYDGLVAYPEHDRKVATFQEIKAKHADDTEKAGEEWKAVATREGWKLDDPGRPKSRFDNISQFVMAGITLPVGFFCLVQYFTSLKRWIATDEEGIKTSWGQRAPFDAIVRLNKTRWKTKGIAFAYYRDQNQEKRIKFDDWYYETEPTRQMVDEIEAKLKPEQIVGESLPEPADAPPPDTAV